MYAQRLKNSGDPYLTLNDELEHLEKMGIDTTNRKNALNVSLMMSQILVKLGLADSMDYAYWNKFNEKSAPLIVDFVNRMNEEGEKFQFFDEYLKLVKLVAPRIGIRKFNWREFAKAILTDIYNYTPAKAEQTINKFYPKNK